MTLAVRRSQRAAPGWRHPGSPFHPGEQRVQSYLGVREQVERAGRNGIRDEMPDQHRELFEALPLLVLGSMDDAGRLWASILPGPPGFVRSPTSRSLIVTAQPLAGDPLARNLLRGAALGLLGIQLETRRRNRANGRVSARDAHSFSVQVEQSFGNCKQYIQAREPTFDPALLGAIGAEGARLSAPASALLTRSDTLFIASASAAATSGIDGEGVDVSHRGGRPGFVRVSGPGELEFPSYDGNGQFRSLGNVLANPAVGLLFIDFESPRRLRVNGLATLLDDAQALSRHHGAQLVVRVRAERIFPNCPRYIHRSGGAELSADVPRPGHEPPAAKWKSMAIVADVLPR